MTAKQLYRLSPADRVKCVLASTSLGRSSSVEIIERSITVAVPATVCPGKLMAEVAALAQINDTEVAPISDTDGTQADTLSLSQAITRAPQGCRGMRGKRKTNLIFLQAVLQAMVDRGVADKVSVSVAGAS